MNASANSPAGAAKTRYIMIGGFLGAGKTTAVGALAQRFKAQGLRVGLITNDQGRELVDTAMLRAKGFDTQEIAGGCFCCRFNSLVDAAAKLTAATAPDIFIAEPVGSCTDLVATVTYPLRRIYGERFTIAPLSVLVDPIRAERILGLAAGGKFSENVRYIYRKQLEEADLILISKCELLDAPRLAALRAALEREFPQASVCELSVRENRGVEPWLAQLAHGEQGQRPALEMDYERYGQGEALLGWLNATVSLRASDPAAGFDSSLALTTLATDIQARLGDCEIAHLKMTLSPDAGLGDIAVINLVRSDFVPELSLTLDEPVHSAQLIVNLRAEADPEALREAVDAAVAELPATLACLQTRLEHLEHFRPGQPQPTHRDVSGEPAPPA